VQPTPSPSHVPTVGPSEHPTFQPTANPTHAPTAAPSVAPTVAPTSTDAPTTAPTAPTFAPSQSAAALSAQGAANTQNNGTSGTVIALATVMSVLCCVGVAYFLYTRRYANKGEDDKELSPYEKWMRNEEVKHKSGMDDNFRFSAQSGMDMNDIYATQGNSEHNPMGDSHMSNGSGSGMGMGMGMNNGAFDPRMSNASGMSGYDQYNPNMMQQNNMMQPGFNGSTHNPMNGSPYGGNIGDGLHQPAQGQAYFDEGIDPYDFDAQNQQQQSPAAQDAMRRASTVQGGNPLVKQYRQSMSGRRQSTKPQE
jgi:hypothetical protein